MVVRIRLTTGPKIRRGRRKNRHVALALGSLITPGAVVASVLGFWRLGADLKLTGQFAIAGGFFSHWQVWLGSAALLESIAIALNRYGNSELHAEGDG